MSEVIGGSGSGMKNGHLSIEYRAIDSITEYSGNSRTHSDEQIDQVAASIQEFGFTNPLLIDHDGVLIAGHGRLLAAKKLNIDSVPVIEIGHFTDNQRRAYVIADNKLAENSSWDEAALAREMADATNQPGDVISRILDITNDEIKHLSAAGVVIKTGADKYNLFGSVRGYIGYLREQNKKSPTQVEIAEHLDMSERNARTVLNVLQIDWRETTLEKIRISYIRDLREKAAGRGGDNQESLTCARIRESQANAQIKELQYHEAVGDLIPAVEIEPLLDSWAVTARSETTHAMEKIIASIQSKYDIEVDQDLIDEQLGGAYKAIADYPKQFSQDVVESGGELETTTQN